MPPNPIKTDVTALSETISHENPLLIGRIAKALEIQEDEALTVFTEVLRFLYLIGKYNERLTPSLKIDNAWHEFILFTRLYMRTCQEHFGRYIHHSPGGDESDNKARFERTLQIYEESFGPVPRNPWGLGTETDPAPCGPCQS